ncbi:hypothetical protein ABTN29_19815 [Acinetobacter baumannii]
MGLDSVAPAWDKRQADAAAANDAAGAAPQTATAAAQNTKQGN